MATAPKVASSLAVDGGTPVRTTPFAPWPSFAPQDIEAAAAVLRHGTVNYWTGTDGREFEKEFAEATDSQFAVVLANGTVALELALRALNIGPGDEVITTPRTFLASATGAMLLGAKPVFADVDPNSGDLTAASVERAITPRTRAIIAVHLAGWPCDLSALAQLAASRGIALIEDCAQAHGAKFQGRSVGSFGRFNAWSFCQDKIMTTAGEGGMITTNDKDLWDFAWSYKDHGKSYQAVYERRHAPGYRWLHESLGSNWRLSEVQSAVGRSMLRRLPEMVDTRRRNARVLLDRLSALSALRVPAPAPGIDHSYYKFYCYVRPEALRGDWSRDRLMSAITAEGIPCFSGSCSEVYLEKVFPADLRPAQRLPMAKELGETSLMFLVHPTLTAADMHQTCDAVEKVLLAATR